MNSKKRTAGNVPNTTGTNNQGMLDPIGALQTLARQGTGNNQIMGMRGSGPNHQGIIPQPPASTATNPSSSRRGVSAGKSRVIWKAHRGRGGARRGQFIKNYFYFK
ncbi:uncharacterized protein LOC105190692 [Harpegnathos saltator]|uniref:uncharacterized protein LOC105190692 n=1 Tax=Harpegnathos saltator TaxID=610380 RepID=UPI000DBEF183|nr:uncharacterized protein LOC105190692 [Harpegnathos saltator]